MHRNGAMRSDGAKICITHYTGVKRISPVVEELTFYGVSFIFSFRLPNKNSND